MSIQPPVPPRRTAVLATLAAALACVAIPVHAQQTSPAMQEAVDALARALREKSYEILEPHLDPAYHVDHLTGERARQAMGSYIQSGMRIPAAVHVDSSWTDEQGQTRASTRFDYPGQPATVVLTLTPEGRFVEVPLFRIQRIEGMSINGAGGGSGGGAGVGGAAAGGPAAGGAGQRVTFRAAQNPALQQELVRMAALDQQYRGQAGGRAPMDSAAVRARSEADRANLRRLEDIIAQHGWPGATLVGEEGSRAAFLVLQHGDLAAQERYLPLVRQAAASRELAPGLAAMLEDRVLMQRGEPQIYGTQLRVDPATGRATLYQVRDEAAVDQRRASVGLNPLAEYLTAFGITYRAPAAQP